jgi:hypothetical protein
VVGGFSTFQRGALRGSGQGTWLGERECGSSQSISRGAWEAWDPAGPKSATD